MSCPFYGKHASILVPAIVDQGGNQCAIIIGSYAPCIMEVSQGREPDAATCKLLRATGEMRDCLVRCTQALNQPPRTPKPEPPLSASTGKATL